MTFEQPSRPANMENIIAINQGNQPLSLEIPTPTGLLAHQFQAKLDQGFSVVDTRSPAEFGSCHIPGAINIQLDSTEFEQRVGWVLPSNLPLLLITKLDDEIGIAINKLAFIGLETSVKGYLTYGMKAWMDEGLPSTTLPQISVHDLKSKLDEDVFQILDVRDNSEWDAGHIANAKHINYKSLWNKLPNNQLLDPEKPIAVICAGGYRSSTASSILLHLGYKDVHNVTGGMDAWTASRYPVRDTHGLHAFNVS